MKKIKETLCKDCMYFEDRYMRKIPAPTKKDVFRKIEVPYGICNNVNNKEYRCSCWECYYCKNGRKISRKYLTICVALSSP